jgi:hypothetical protein
MATLLTDQGAFEVSSNDGLWVSAADAARATGWTLKPEGMCRDEICVPLPASAVRGDQVDLAAFWDKLGAPRVGDASGAVWALGASVADRTSALTGLMAPDFELPDLAGTPHRLSALRKKKVFLATWASW